VDKIRYGYYLRPPAVMCRAQVEMHQLLERQYGLPVAGKFMPHATIKGFFKPAVDEAELIARLDPLAMRRRPFPVHNGGAVAHGKSSIVLTIQRLADGARNEALQDIHEAAMDALGTAIAPDCDFSPREGVREHFHAHLTLAMAIETPEYFDEIFAFVHELEPIGPADFVADTFHLYRFQSDDWAGRWGETLRWELRRSWTLT
jgi:2'-5' RNA ligase